MIITKIQTEWLEASLCDIAKSDAPPAYTITLMEGDASTRRYYTVDIEGMCFVLVVAEHECNLRFVHMTHALSGSEVRVPYVFALQARPERMDGALVSCALLSFVGSKDLLYASTQKGVRPKMLYMQAIAQIHQLQTIDLEIDSYDEASLMMESNLFAEWFVPYLAQKDTKLVSLYEKLCSVLVPELLGQPFVLAHRDYHAKNIFMNDGDNGRLYTIDYQDAILAPITYDLVSLLKDCYIDIGDKLRGDLCKHFYSHLPEGQQFGFDKFMHDFNIMGVQRHLKIAGIFVRLFVRDKKPDYLDYIPLCIDYILATCEGLPYGQDFASALRDQTKHLPKRIEELRAT